jgi:hypothetical protein
VVEYGPNGIDRFTQALPGRRAAVYLTMSTWNPYNVVEMAADPVVVRNGLTDAGTAGGRRRRGTSVLSGATRRTWRIG